MPSACALALLGERDGLVAGARDVAVALEAPDHLVDGRSGQLTSAGDVRPGHRQSGLEEPEEGLEVLLFGEGGLGTRHDFPIYCPRSAALGCSTR